MYQKTGRKQQHHNYVINIVIETHYCTHEKSLLNHALNQSNPVNTMKSCFAKINTDTILLSAPTHPTRSYTLCVFNHGRIVHFDLTA
jgi:hypothetical protein